MGLDGWDWILLRTLVQLEHLAVLKIDQTGFLCPYCSKKACRRRNAVSKWLKINSYPVSNNSMQLFNIQTRSTTTWQSKWLISQFPITQYNCSIFKRGQQPPDSQEYLSNNSIRWLSHFETGSTTTWWSRLTWCSNHTCVCSQVTTQQRNVNGWHTLICAADHLICWGQTTLSFKYLNICYRWAQSPRMLKL